MLTVDLMNMRLQAAWRAGAAITLFFLSSAQKLAFDLGFTGEQVAQVLRTQRFGMRRQGAPGGGFGRVHNQIMRPVSNLWISSGCAGRMRIRYSSLPHSSGVSSRV